MSIYGQFEATQQLYQTARGAVFAARQMGGAQTTGFCIKWVDSTAAPTAAQDLLVCATLQQALAATSPAWAPIYQFASQPNGSFYVTRLYRKSAQDLIDSAARLSPNELLTLLSTIVDGLIALRAVQNRQHGNLKPSNILLNDLKSAPGGIVITDPNPRAELVPSATRPPDAKAIGEILFALVTQRSNSAARWPVQPSPEWNRLGPASNQWLALCNDLLNLRTFEGSDGLGLLRARLQEIRPAVSTAPRLRYVALAAAAVIAVTAFAEREKIKAAWPNARTQISTLMQAPALPAVASNTPPATPPRPTAGTPTIIPAAVAPPVVTPPVQKPTPPIVIPAPRPAVATVDPSPWINDLKKQSPPAFLPELAAQAYIQRRDELATSAQANPAALQACKSSWMDFNGRVNNLEFAYPSLPLLDNPRPWQRDLTTAMAHRRSTDLAAAVLDPQANPAAYQKLFATSTDLLQTGPKAEDELTKSAPPTDADATRADISQLDDAPCRTAVAPLSKLLDSWYAVKNAPDRHTLLDIITSESTPTPLRLLAWQRLSEPAMHAASLTELAEEKGAADFLKSQLTDPDAQAKIDQTLAQRRADFFQSLADDQSVAPVLAAESTANPPIPIAQTPPWFQYDLALANLQTRLKTNPAAVAIDTEIKQMAVQATAAGSPAVAQWWTSLNVNAAPAPPPNFDRVGPGATGWTYRPLRGSYLYISPANVVLEFRRVQSANSSIGCYLCTTDISVAMLKDALVSPPSRLRVARKLNAGVADLPGVHIWNFAADDSGIELTDENYHRYFRPSPDDSLPAQFVTPKLAMYVASLLGCRLPSAAEWRAALIQELNCTTDKNRQGYASLGWKLRDQYYQQLISQRLNLNVWPDDGIFLGPDPSKLANLTAANATVWQQNQIDRLHGHLLSNTNAGLAIDDLQDLVSDPSAAFRPVGKPFGVFHDLIGNVAEFVLDQPSLDSQAAPPATASPETISTAFTPVLPHVAVIGGSALSPPQIDPTTPQKLPSTGPSAFADVGFRLAFSDPAAKPDTRPLAIAQAKFMTAGVSAEADRGR